MRHKSGAWWVYMLGCVDGSYYIGITAHLALRMYQHASGQGARYTQVRLPVSLLRAALVRTEAEALQLEGILKQQPLVHKERLLSNHRLLQVAEIEPYLPRIDLFHADRGKWRDGESGVLHSCLRLCYEGQGWLARDQPGCQVGRVDAEVTMKKGAIPGQIPYFPIGNQMVPPEWSVVQEIVQVSRSSDSGRWLAFSQCRQVVIYTDGSVPVVNPGGPAGFSAIVAGFDQLLSSSASNMPQPMARLDLAGYIPARTTEPRTTNNRAELAGVLAALAALAHLNLANYTAPEIVIWSDSVWTVKCGNGDWGRTKNMDLWLQFDELYRQARDHLPCPYSLRWLKGHAGNTLNEEADKVATLAALNFDQRHYARLRAAQATTGWEMPGRAAVEHQTPDSQSSTAGSTDYTIVLTTHLDGGGQPSVGRGPARGDYLLETRLGHRYRGRVTYPGLLGADQGEYLTLTAALEELLIESRERGRIRRHSRPPSSASVKW